MKYYILQLTTNKKFLKIIHANTDEDMKTELDEFITQGRWSPFKLIKTCETIEQAREFFEVNWAMNGGE